MCELETRDVKPALNLSFKLKSATFIQRSTSWWAAAYKSTVSQPIGFFS